MKIVYSKYPFETPITESAPAVSGPSRDQVYTKRIIGGYSAYILENPVRIFDAVLEWLSLSDDTMLIESEIDSVLVEDTYKDLRSKVTDFLQVRQKSKDTPGSRFVDYKDGVMHFKTDSHRIGGVEYDQYVKLLDLEKIMNDNPGKPMAVIARLVLQGDIEVHCTDPSWKYYGFQYIGTTQDFSIEPENRPPDTRNPRKSGSVCKHLDNVLYTLPFQSARLAKYLSSAKPVT